MLWILVGNIVSHVPTLMILYSVGRQADETRKLNNRRLSSATYSPAIRSNKRRHFRGPSKNSRILHLYRGENYNDQSFLWAVIFPVPGKKRPSHHSYDLLDLGHLRVCHERIVRGE